MSEHERIKRALLLNQEKSRLHDYYDKWSDDYDKDVADENYVAPHTIANLAVALYRNFDGLSCLASRSECRVLDAGCGTGLVGVTLAANGFENIIGVDLSPKMVSVAHETDTYKALFGDIDLTQSISDQLVNASDLPIEDTREFDMTVCVGVFTLGHVPPSVLGKLVDVTRSDGLVLVTAREEYCDKHNFTGVYRELESSGRVTVELERYDNYVSDDRALYLALRVS